MGTAKCICQYVIAYLSKSENANGNNKYTQFVGTAKCICQYVIAYLSK